MKIIIDTHIFLWALSEPHKLSPTHKKELQAKYNQIFVSSITVAELMIKSSLGKLNINFDPKQMINEIGFEHIDFSASDAMLLKTMPFHHKDLFDRMLIAQSQAHDFYLMSQDNKFTLYDCKLI